MKEEDRASAVYSFRSQRSWYQHVNELKREERIEGSSVSVALAVHSCMSQPQFSIIGPNNYPNDVLV